MFGQPDRYLIPPPIRSSPYYSAEVAMARSILISMCLYRVISSKFPPYLICLQHLVRLVTHSYLNDFLPLTSWTLLSLVALTPKPFILRCLLLNHLLSLSTLQGKGLELLFSINSHPLGGLILPHGLNNICILMTSKCISPSCPSPLNSRAST